ESTLFLPARLLLSTGIPAKVCGWIRSRMTRPRTADRQGWRGPGLASRANGLPLLVRHSRRAGASRPVFFSVLGFFVEFVMQLVRCDRFDEITVDAAGFGLDAIAFVREAGDRDNLDVLEFRMTAYRLRDFEAVHIRHGDIEQDHIRTERQSRGFGTRG